MDKKNEIHDQISYIRLHEKFILLAELVGVKRREQIEVFDVKEAKRLFKQKIDFLEVDTLGIKVLRIWNRFILQLKENEY